MNFKKNVVSPIKHPLFPGYGNDYTTSQPKKSVSLLTLFIVIIVTFVLAFAVFKNIDRIGNIFSSSVSTPETFQIGQEVALSGELAADGDLVSYTHTLSLYDGTIVGIKSKNLDLSQYSWFVDIQWIVDKQLDSLFIIDVTTISWALTQTWIVQEIPWSWNGLYMSQAGMYFPSEFFQSYTLLNNWENWEIKLNHLASNQPVTIVYFACKKTDPNKDCAQLKQNISDGAEKSITTVHGDKLYKLEWVTSWFFTNGNFYGYFINDVSEQEVSTLANAIVLPTDAYVQNTLMTKLQTLCTDGSSSLMQVIKHVLGIDLNGLYAQLEWPTANGSATCKVFIDPSKSAWWSKISYITNTPGPSEIATTTTANVPALDTSVKQFPINLEKTMTFTSNRWYAIVFPSMNIAYEALNIDEDLDLPGVRCSSQMNITKYADKATMHEDPKISIYVCNIKWTLNNLGNSIIQKTSANDMQFLIKINDGAWNNFANNIQIQ